MQRRPRWIFRGRDKNQDFGIFKNGVKQESRILKSSRILAVKNQDFVSNFLDFKQESRKVKQQFFISSISQDLKFRKRLDIQTRIERITLYLTLKVCIFYHFSLYMKCTLNVNLVQEFDSKNSGFQEFCSIIFKFKTRSRIFRNKFLNLGGFRDL